MYHETTDAEKAAIEQALVTDTDFAHEYRQLKTLMSSLETVKEEPSQKSVDAILAYSKSINLHSVPK
ncbi:hypothetical protein QWY31_08210 [Cytophagales bacterium LB-30]|uniref:Uncharacterized protein n=1 Tax=Shiella aurantiaca TaxID=3058365 RepID=A0ABT8F4V8_9BACT|nr:hypothetical protein [Shiella aurantiaca]MDN4165480.1 hypothetical protein [Shiella aurantiaca]